MACKPKILQSCPLEKTFGALDLQYVFLQVLLLSLEKGDRTGTINGKQLGVPYSMKAKRKVPYRVSFQIIPPLSL